MRGGEGGVSGDSTNDCGEAGESGASSNAGECSRGEAGDSGESGEAAGVSCGDRVGEWLSTPFTVNGCGVTSLLAHTSFTFDLCGSVAWLYT